MPEVERVWVASGGLGLSLRVVEAGRKKAVEMVGYEQVSQTERRSVPAGNAESQRTIVVMELGAAWPAWLGDAIGDCGGSAVHAQGSGELPSAFATRVVQRIGSLSAAERVQLAVLSWSAEVSALILSARFRIARAMIQAMRDVSGAELVLSASAGPADANRHELLALVAALCEELSDAQVVVSVTFSSASIKSRTVVRGSVERLQCIGVAG